MQTRLLVIGLFLLVLTTAARADVLYTVTSENGPMTYSFTEPDILTGYTVIPGSSITSTGITTQPFFAELDPTGGACSFSYLSPGDVCLGLQFGGGGAVGFFSEPLTTLGFHAADLTYGVDGVDIEEVTPPVATPEPSSIALLSTGLLGVVGSVRRRLA